MLESNVKKDGVARFTDYAKTNKHDDSILRFPLSVDQEILKTKMLKASKS